MWMIIAITGGLAAFLLSMGIARLLAEPLQGAFREGASSPDSQTWRHLPEVLMRRFNASPNREKLAEEMDRKLILAARPSDLTGPQYLALMQVAAGGAALVVLVLGLLGGMGAVWAMALAAALAGLVWWYLKNQLDAWVAARRKAISREFPYFLDLAVLMMGAGANFGEVLQGYLRTAGNSKFAADARALEAEVRAGLSTDTALALLESRIPAPDVVAVIRAIRQGTRLGTPLTRTFTDQAEAIRFRRSQRAERDAEELKVRLQGPTMLLMIAVLLLVLGPALVSMTQGGF